MLKLALGVLLFVGGIVFGTWAGVWWALVGGIVDLVSAFRAPDLVALDIAWGIAKIVLAGAIGCLASIVGVLPGLALVKSA